MAKITSVNGLVLDAQTLQDPARGTGYLNGTQIENTATGEKFTVCDQEVNTPQSVYTATRPLDWLPMIMPQDNEIYMLFHIYGESSLVAFSVTGGSYTVELGTVLNGQFLANSTHTQTKNSGSTYENEIFYDDFSDVTDDGAKQCMIKITGTGSISQFSILPHSEHSYNSFMDWNIVEWWGKCPDITVLTLSSVTAQRFKNLCSLKYLRIAGENKIALPAGFASFMTGLIAILEYKVAENISSLSFDNFLCDCVGLQALPPLHITSSVSLNNAFSNTDLKSIKLTFAENAYPTAMGEGAFSNNYSLAKISRLETGNVTEDIDTSNNPQIKEVYIDTNSSSGYVTLLHNYAMHSLLFNPQAANAPEMIYATYNSMDKAALRAMFESLPTAESASTVTITGSRGASELTTEDIAVATEKNWTVVI